MQDKNTCCNQECNQGRACPVRAGTHKPAEAVHQIQEPTVNQQLTDERESFGIPQCPFPCGWKNLYTLLVAEGAFLARSLQEDEPITEHQRATVMRVVNYGLEMARTALAATPAANAPQHQGMTIAGNGAAELGKLMREQWETRGGVYPDGNPNAGHP